VQAHATDGAMLFDNRDALAELCGLNRATLAGGSAADADEIVIERHGIHVSS